VAGFPGTARVSFAEQVGRDGFDILSGRIMTAAVQTQDSFQRRLQILYSLPLHQGLQGVPAGALSVASPGFKLLTG
jgi:hypothetical protein